MPQYRVEEISETRPRLADYYTLRHVGTRLPCRASFNMLTTTRDEM